MLCQCKAHEISLATDHLGITDESVDESDEGKREENEVCSPEKSEKISSVMQATLSMSSPAFFTCGIVLKSRGPRRGLGIAAKKKEATELRFELWVDCKRVGFPLFLSLRTRIPEGVSNRFHCCSGKL